MGVVEHSIVCGSGEVWFVRRVVVVGSQDVFDGVGAVFEDLSEDEGARSTQGGCPEDD